MVSPRIIFFVLAAGLAATAIAHATETAGPVPRLFERFDSNNDGMLTESEIAKRTEKRFKRLDRNRDRVVDEKELQVYLDARARKKTSSANASTKGKDADRLMKKFDTDGNGSVSPSEYTSISLLRLLKADTNADKIISVAEYVARKPKKSGKADEEDDLSEE